MEKTRDCQLFMSPKDETLSNKAHRAERTNKKVEQPPSHAYSCSVYSIALF